MIIITSEALNYLNNKAIKELCIEYPEYRVSGESPLVITPEVIVKKPKDEAAYNKITVDGISVFVSKNVKLPKIDVTVYVEKFFFLNFIKLDGFSVNE